MRREWCKSQHICGHNIFWPIKSQEGLWCFLDSMPTKKWLIICKKRQKTAAGLWPFACSYTQQPALQETQVPWTNGTPHRRCCLSPRPLQRSRRNSPSAESTPLGWWKVHLFLMFLVHIFFAKFIEVPGFCFISVVITKYPTSSQRLQGQGAYFGNFRQHW